MPKRRSVTSVYIRQIEGQYKIRTSMAKPKNSHTLHISIFMCLRSHDCALRLIFTGRFEAPFAPEPNLCMIIYGKPMFNLTSVKKKYKASQIYFQKKKKKSLPLKWHGCIYRQQSQFDATPRTRLSICEYPLASLCHYSCSRKSLLQLFRS